MFQCKRCCCEFLFQGLKTRIEKAFRNKLGSADQNTFCGDWPQFSQGAVGSATSIQWITIALSKVCTTASGIYRRRGRVVRPLDLQFGGPEFKSRSNR